MEKEDDTEFVGRMVIDHKISVFRCYENRDGVLEKPEWLAVDKPMGFDYGHDGHCGVGADPVSAINDLLRVLRELKKSDSEPEGCNNSEPESCPRDA